VQASKQATAPHSMSPWLDAARAAIVDIARQALGSTVVIGEPGAVPDGLSGALIPIVSKLDPVQIGLFSTDEGCEGLARALLGSSPGEKVTRPEVVDALGEIVNMFSGNVKARVARYATHAALGLPTFVHGPVEAQSSQVIDVLPVTIGDIKAYVLVMHFA